MKKYIIYALVAIMVIVIGIECVIIFNQKSEITSLNNTIKITKQKEAQKKDDLTKKIIIATYNEVRKYDNITTSEIDAYNFELADRISNLKTIAASYIENDPDVKTMFPEIISALQYKKDNLYKVDQMAKEQGDKIKATYRAKYSKAQDSINKCISKYGLFEKIKLD